MGNLWRGFFFFLVGSLAWGQTPPSGSCQRNAAPGPTLTNPAVEVVQVYELPKPIACGENLLELGIHKNLKVSTSVCGHFESHFPNGKQVVARPNKLTSYIPNWSVGHALSILKNSEIKEISNKSENDIIKLKIKSTFKSVVRQFEAFICKPGKQCQVRVGENMFTVIGPSVLSIFPTCGPDVKEMPPEEIRGTPRDKPCPEERKLPESPHPPKISPWGTPK